MEIFPRFIQFFCPNHKYIPILKVCPILMLVGGIVQDHSSHQEIEIAINDPKNFLLNDKLIIFCKDRNQIVEH